MTQSPFDSMSKQYLEEMLSPFGLVERQYEVPGEAKYVDVWFVPNGIAGAVESLGLLGRMVERPSLFEPYRNVPLEQDIRVGTMKMVWVQEDERRRAKLDVMPRDRLPVLWVLAAKMSKPLLQTFRLLPDPAWPQGVYFSGDGYTTGVVVIDELPVTDDTLWIRVLGRGETQKQAIKTLLAMPKSTPRRFETLRLVFSWRVTIDIDDLEAEFATQEEIMALSEAYLTWEAELLGASRQQEKESIALNMMRKNMSLDVVAEVTGLTIAQLQMLQADRL
jgi:hypothetical protein